PPGPPDPETTNPDTIDKYYETVNLEQEIACLMLSMKAKPELFETVKAFYACKQEEGQSNYNMHIMGKTIVELHAMLKLHEKGISKKAETPAVLAIREGKIQKDKEKPQGEKGKDKGLRESKKLKQGALSLYAGNGMRAAVEAIGSFDLVLPSGLIIVLDNCHFAPTITRDVVSIFHLVNNGYILTFTKYGISISKDNVFYFNAIPRDGIYEIDMHNL
nr:zinc finger, CCHC-type [Tanacetum cinerariifolium]